MHTVGVHHVCHNVGRHPPCQLWEFFRLTADTISEIFYYSVSTNVNYYQTRCWRQFCFQQDSTLAHHACNTVKLQGRELSTSLLLIMAFNLTAEQWNYWLRFRDSHISKSISCKPTRLKKSSSDWLKWKDVIFVFFYFTRQCRDII